MTGGSMWSGRAKYGSSARRARASICLPPCGRASAAELPTVANKPKRKPERKGPSKNRLSEQQKAERTIEAAEAALSALEAELADPAAWATRYEAAKSEARHTAATRAVEDAYARLEALVD